MVDRKKSIITKSSPDLLEGENGLLTISDVNIILEANQKALTIYLEVEKQNEDIIKSLSEQSQNFKKIDLINDKLKEVIENQVSLKEKITENKDLFDKIKSKIDEIDRAIFKLSIMIGGAGAGSLITIIQSVLKH